MDLKQTGKFIAELRKERNMLQSDLASELHVTDKAVSRWETGRGLPDADSMLALSSFFDVTINELLMGKRNETPEKAKKEEATVAVECLKTSRKKKNMRVWIAALSAALLLALILSCLAFTALYKNVTGSAQCVIAEDYSYITLFGSKYLPFDIGENICVPGTVLIEEAQVENADFFTKLLFGDRIQLVNGCDNADFIYLNSEYDGPSEYYCLESAYEKYTALLQAPKEKFAAEIITKSRNAYDLLLDDDVVAAITSNSRSDVDGTVNCEIYRSRGEESIVVYRKAAAGPFRRAVGELLYKNGTYYWFDYADIPAGQNNADYRGVTAHPLPENVREKCGKLFDLMFK